MCLPHRDNIAVQMRHLHAPSKQALVSNLHNGASHPRVRHSAIKDARHRARGNRLRMAGVFDRLR
jgi:hypothetical protein